MIQLRGMTWNHDRGLAPMLATAARFHERHPEVTISWEVRSLRDFGDAPVEILAEQFDIVVIDHPFMGDLARARCFLALQDLVGAEQLAQLAADSVGASHASYVFQDQQWALAIDAACQVASCRVDLLDREGATCPRTWEEVLRLAQVRPGFVSLPLTPLDTLMSFFSLCANAGEPCFAQPGVVATAQTGEYALDLLRQLGAQAAPGASSENPIALYERMSTTEETACCPLAFGYSNYARPGYRPKLLSYGSIPSAGKGQAGATLGGAGLAISTHCLHREQAVSYAATVASAACQSGLYVESGGQPASRTAWESDAANAVASGYFRATRSALESAWVRPRFAGFVPFQNEAGQVIAQHMAGALSARETLGRFDEALRHAEKG